MPSRSTKARNRNLVSLTIVAITAFVLLTIFTLAIYTRSVKAVDEARNAKQEANKAIDDWQADNKKMQDDLANAFKEKPIEKPAQKPIPIEGRDTTPQIFAEAVIEARSDNELAFARQYGNKWLRVVGRVVKIRNTESGVTVTLRAYSLFNDNDDYMICEVSPDCIHKFDQYQHGESICVLGYCELPNDEGHVRLKQCDSVDWLVKPPSR